jgi:hypothetical protein
MLDMGTPEPGKCKDSPMSRKLTIEERVRSACELIDSNHESRKDWELIRKLNNYLMRKDKLTKREQNILKMIQPIIEKYGQHSVAGVEMDASKHSTTTGGS